MPDAHVSVDEFSEAQEAEGKLSKQDEEDKLMNSLLENDKEAIAEGKTISEALNQGIGAFTPDSLFEKIVKNYSIAEQAYGPALLRFLTTYNPNYLQRNARIPEFQKELKQKITGVIESLKEKGILTEEGAIADKGVKLASVLLLAEELDALAPRGILGERFFKKTFTYGDRENVKAYAKGDRYKDIALKRSITLAVHRGHGTVQKHDLRTYERQAKGQIHLVYAIDASASMRGRKIEQCKKAGIALAYKAIEEKDKVGLIIFGDEIREAIQPTDDFKRLLFEITKISARKQTNIALTISKAIEVFPQHAVTRHLILITDAMPTAGEEPEQETLDAVELAARNNITISLIGIQLSAEGKKLAEKIVALGRGKLFNARDTENIDVMVLEDYFQVG
ncbi:VWA domain-containing protein [Candidatus Woesearchaeota archaeon]|nr:VWA domain-containing protein [Candidatus Woesearchaeota archaeon]